MAAAVTRQSKVVVQAGLALDNGVVQMRGRFRAAIEAKRDTWKLEAIAAHMAEHGCPGLDAPFLHKLYSGERTITIKHIAALPDDIEAAYHALNAEAFDGQLVIRPAAAGVEAVKSFVSGLLGLQLPQLPAKAGPPAKAGLSPCASSAVPPKEQCQ